MINDNFCFYVPKNFSGTRLDVCITTYLGYYSRSHLANIARNGDIYVNGVTRKPSYKVAKGELVLGFIHKNKSFSIDAEAIPLDIIYEDSSIIVINKRAGIVVHPSPGHFSGTVVNAVMYHCNSSLKQTILGKTIRPGIVHRIDKNTSGVLVIAKNTKSLINISSQFKQRNISKQYIALVYGVPKDNQGNIDFAIGRHRINRKKMSIHSKKLRPAKTLWRVLEYYDDIASLLEINIKTGRTHQIRVHCSAIGHPILGDIVYKNKGTERKSLKTNHKNRNLLLNLNRHMLHAKKIQFIHPENNRHLTFEANLPNDISNLLKSLRINCKKN